MTPPLGHGRIRNWAVLICSLALIGFLHPGGKLIQLPWFAKAAWTAPLLAGGLWFLRGRKWRCVGRRGGLLALSMGILLYLFSSSATDPTFHFLNWPPGSPWQLGRCWLERTLLLTAILMPVIAMARKRMWPMLWVCLGIMQVAALAALWHATGGAPMYRVDHPAFFFRLWSFGQSMPRFISYDPFWNGGRVMPYLVASGILSPGLFLWPVWKFMQTTVAYTPAFGALFVVVVPLMAAFSARLVSRNRIMPPAAALLSLGTCHFYFIHLVHYGTIGSLFAASFLMPMSAALYRLVMRRQTDMTTLSTLFVSGFFLLCWPPATIMAIPMGAALLVNCRRLTPRTTVALLAFAVAMVVIFALPAASLLAHSEVGSFMQSSSAPLTGKNLHAGWETLTQLLRQTHPILIFLGLLGTLVSPARGIRRWFGPILVVSLLITLIGAGWKEELQLDRTLINALFIAILPAAWATATLFRSRVAGAVPAAALLAALLAMNGYNAVKYMGNRGRAHFRTMSDEVSQMAEWLKSNTPSNGRIMFAGAAVHGYSAAKVAALPVYTEREMLSCDYYGFSPRLVEYNYPPREFRKHGRDKLLSFMNIYNITHIVTYHADWKRLFRTKLSDQYEEVATFGAKSVFRVKRESSMFLEGSGTVSAGINRIEVSPGNVDSAVVIKYNWVDGLTCKPAGAMIEPYDTGTSVRLIKVIPNGAEHVLISYTRWY